MDEKNKLPSPEEFEKIVVEVIPEDAQTILEEAVRVSHLDIIIDSLDEFSGVEEDELAGSGKSPFSRKITVIYSDGVITRGEPQKVGTRGSISGAGDWETPVHIDNATVVITKLEERDEDLDVSLITVYAKDMDDYQAYVNRLIKENNG